MPGDMAALSKIVASLGQLASRESLGTLSLLLAEEAMVQVADGFRQSRDPYGTAWKPLKLRPGGKPLQDTRRMQRSITKQLTDANGFRIGTNFVGAKVHQYGAVIRPVKAKALRFRGVSYSQTGHRRTYTGFIFAQQVTIPARQYLPEGQLGPIWEAAFERVTRAFVSRLMPKR